MTNLYPLILKSQSELPWISAIFDGYYAIESVQVKVPGLIYLKYYIHYIIFNI